MSNEEINVLFELASEYAENAYYEIFNRIPDTSKPATQEILDMMMHAWLSGYSYLRIDSDLDKTLFEVFGYHWKVGY